MTRLALPSLTVCCLVSLYLCQTSRAQTEEANRADRSKKFFSQLDFDRDGKVSKTELGNQALCVDLVVGAKGSPLQMTLNSMFYLSQPVENISYQTYKKFIVSKTKDGKEVKGAFARHVHAAVPLCLGDSFKGFRVIGTNSLFLEEIPMAMDGNDEPLGFTFKSGSNFKDEDFFCAVLGSNVAKKFKLKIGDEIQTSHGPEGTLKLHETPFKVTGILDSGNSPHDNAVFVNMEGFYLQEDHALLVEEKVLAKEGVKTKDDNLVPLPESQREVTSVLVLISKKDEFGILKMIIPNQLRQMNVDAQAVNPFTEILVALEAIDDLSLFYSLKGAFDDNGSVNKEDFSEFNSK